MDNDKLIHLIRIRCSDQSSHHAYDLSETMPNLWQEVQEPIWLLPS